MKKEPSWNKNPLISSSTNLTFNLVKLSIVLFITSIWFDDFLIKFGWIFFKYINVKTYDCKKIRLMNKNFLKLKYFKKIAKH